MVAPLTSHCSASDLSCQAALPVYALVVLFRMLRGVGELQVHYWLECGTDGPVFVPGHHLFPSSCWSHSPQSKQGM